jgi:hypothetical protein
MNEGEPLQPLSSADYLEELLKAGYMVKGPRNDAERDAASLKRFLEKGKEYAPEEWLSNSGYKFVEPSTFTKGHRIAYKIIDDFPDERFNTPYSLVRNDREIPLYLQNEVPKLE